MMFNSLPNILQQESELIYELFDGMAYIPILLQDAFIVSWPSDLDEHLFISPTSIITKGIIQTHINHDVLGISTIQNENNDRKSLSNQ